MKKLRSLISILVCLTMVLAMVPPVFAAEGDTFVKVTDVADLAVGDQIIIVSDDADYALSTNQKNNNREATAITKDGDAVTATADVQVLTLEAGAVDGTFAFNTGAGYLYAASSSKNYLRTEEALSANSSWNITIADGATSVVAAGENTRATMQYNPNSGAPLFACYGGATQGAISIYKLTENTEEEPTETENPLVLGDNTLTSGVTYTYTVPADGRLEMDITTIKDSAGSTIYSYAYNQGTRVQVLVDGQVISMDATRCNVAAGQKITVQVVSVDGDTYTVTMKLAEVEPAEELVLGQNNIAQDLEYVYTAAQDGTLYISIVELLYNGAQSTASELGNNVSYKINGASVSSFDKSYEVTAGDEIAIVIKDYSWSGNGVVSATINLSYEGFYEQPVGSLANPVELLYADCPTQTVEIPAGTAVWYELESYYDSSAWSTVYPFDDKDLVVTGEYAYVIVGSTRYDAVDGVVTVPMDETVLIQIGNDGEEAAVFELSVSIPEGHEENPQDLVVGDNVVTLPSYTSHYFEFVATEDGTVTILVSGDNWRVYFYHYDAEGNKLAQEDRYYKNSDSDTFTVEIKAGEFIVLNVGTSQGYSQPGGEITVNVQFEPAETAEPENLLVLGDNTLTSGVEYTYVVPADGRMEWDITTIKDSAGSTIYSYTYNQGTRVQVLVDGQVISMDAQRFNVTAGQKITVQVVSVDGNTYTVTMKLAEVEPAETLVLGQNNIAQDLEYVYVAEQDGTLYISIVELLYGGEEVSSSELGNNVKYTINGASVSSLDKSYEVKAGDEIAVQILDYNSWDDATAAAVINLSYEGFYEHPAGSLNNPVDLLYADCPTQTIEIAAGTAVWYELESYYDSDAWSTVYPFNGRDLIVTGQNAYVIVDGVRYDAVDGVVTVRMDSTTLIQIGNDGVEAAVYDLRVSIPEGDKENPQDLAEGDNVVTLPSYTSYYYDFVATGDGTVTIVISGDNWRVYFYHYDAEGNTLAQEDRFFKNSDSDTFTVEIKAGEFIVLNVGTSQGWSQPGGELTVNFHFEPAAPDYVLGDANGDGEINTTDAKLIMQYELGLVSGEDFVLAALDVNGDGKINTTDAKLIMQYELGIIPDFSGDSTPEEPEVPEDTDGKQVTIAEAIEICNEVGSTGTTIKYTITGTVTEVTNTVYGNFYIEDETGTILIYGCYDATGENRYDAMENFPQVGDTVTLYGVLLQYTNADGEVTPEMKNAWCLSGGTGEHPAVDDAPTDSYVTTVEVGVAYKLGMYQGNLGETYYFAGTTANTDYYMSTTADKEAAVNVYLEEVEGGYRMYFYVDGVKTYLDVYQNGSYVNLRLTTEPTAVFTWDADYNTLITDIGGTTYYVGTYNSYSTLSASKFSYISTSFPSHLFP